MTDNPTTIWVAAAAIEQPGGRILMQRRPPGKAHAGLWEFPGGKLEAEESPRAALVREVNEELGIALDPRALALAAFAQTSPDDGAKAIVIWLYTARRWEGEPACLEAGGEIGWFTRAEIAALAMPPLDYQLLTGLSRQLKSIKSQSP